ncbi:hypothetical protein [Mucilaginibacter sp.]
MGASTALAARSGWSIWPGMPGQFAPEWGGQFDAESLVTFRRNWVVNISGISTLMAIRDVLDVLSGKTLDDLSPLPSLDDIVDFSLNNIPFGESDRKIKLPDTLITGPIKADFLKLSEELTRKIFDKSKKQSTSIHSLLSVALLLAGRELSPSWRNEPVKLLHPVSVRKAFNLGNDYNLLFASVITSSDPEKESYWDMAQAIGKSIATAQTVHFIKEGVKATRELFYNGLAPAEIIELLSQNGHHHILFSNLTRSPFAAEAERFKIKTIFGPFVLSAMPGAQTVGAITTNGQLCLTLTAQEPLPGLLKQTKAILEHICYG